MKEIQQRGSDMLMSADPALGYLGKIAKTTRESSPWWPPQAQAPKGAPNVVVVLLDDVGFSDFGCYGSEIQTPNIDALASRGLQFTNYTTVPMCTPARAALMTGKNPHSVGCGWLANNDAGYPGYRAGEMSKDAPTLAELLRTNGYSTYAVGKWHNTADHNVTESGSKDSWPLQRGFDRFYGFLGAETHYFEPAQLVEDNNFTKCDDYPEDYYSTDDWTRKGIELLKAHHSCTPEKPFLLYLPFNAPHVPFHAKPADIVKYRGAYDCGWDAVRQHRFDRQKERGIIPRGAQLSPRSEGVASWEELSGPEREVYARYMEIYAAMIDNVDQNVGKIMQFLREVGALENTLIIITSDNGATSLGGLEGAANISAKRYSRTEDPQKAQQMLQRGELGSKSSFPVYPVGWGNACNAPFRLYKRTPMNGGIRVPFIVHWPEGAKSGIRDQWVHVTDTTPTILDLIGAEYPLQFNGYRTRGFDGVSFREVLTSLEARPKRTKQYYEMEGNRGLISGRWKIVSLQPPGKAIDLDNWMLFDLETDPTECEDLAARMPDKLAELVEAFERDAEAYYVYPLDNRDMRRTLTVPPYLEQSLQEVRTFYPGTNSATMATVTPLIADRDFKLECHYRHGSSDEGVIFSIGDSFGGLVLFSRGGKTFFVYNGEQQMTVVDDLPVEPGDVQFILEHKALGERRGSGAITINGRRVAESISMSPTMLMTVTGEGLDVGLDRRSKVSDLYQDRGSFPYSGTISFVRIEPGMQAPGSYVNRSEVESQRD
jgi:arylsulfatase